MIYLLHFEANEKLFSFLMLELEAPDLTLQIFERECCKQLLHKKRLSEKENLPSKVQYIRSKLVCNICEILVIILNMDKKIVEGS